MFKKPISKLSELTNWLPIKANRKFFDKLQIPSLNINDDNNLDKSKPMVLILSYDNESFMISLDSNGLEYINQCLTNVNPDWVILSNTNIQKTYTIENSVSKVIILDSNNPKEEPLLIPSHSNPNITHDTILSSTSYWISLNHY